MSLPGQGGRTEENMLDGDSAKNLGIVEVMIQ